MEYVLWFHSWGGSDREFPTEAVALAHRAGWIPVLTWEPWERDFVNPTAIQPAYSLSSIAAGAHDAYIRAWAQAARASGGPVVLRFAHEQSTEPGVRSWYPWQGDPEGYRAAFRHIVALFREEGATNVQFLSPLPSPKLRLGEGKGRGRGEASAPKKLVPLGCLPASTGLAACAPGPTA